MSFSTSSASGAIFYGLIASLSAAAIVAIFAKYAPPSMLRLLIRVGRRLPARMRPALRWAADMLFPTWRSRVGVLRPSLEMRLRQIRETRKPRFALVGGIYLDIRLHAVDITMLEPGEFSILDAIEKEVGGSACWVGRYLHVATQGDQRSDLFSRLGDDTFSKDLKRLLKREEWIARFYRVNAKYAQCGVSINLEKRNDQPATTLTHRGSLGGFDWRQIEHSLHRRTKRGSIIYVSGYFRTNLCEGLRAALEGLPGRTVVCIDHGRFRPSDYARAGAALEQAFSDGLIDIYLCNWSEFRAFAREAGVEFSTDATVEDLLKLCEHAGILPPITVVRGAAEAWIALAHTAHDERRIRHVPLDDTVPPPQQRLGTQNAFNAGFLHQLAHGNPDSSIDMAIVEAVRGALHLWVTKTPRNKQPRA